MSKIIHHILILATLFTTSSCEKIIELKDIDPLAGAMAVTAIASTDTVVMAHITKSRNIDELPIGFDFSDYYFFEKHIDDISDSEIVAFFKQNLVTDADVYITVNNNTRYEMKYDEKSYHYISTYTPDENDKIDISINHQTLSPAKSSTIIPSKKQFEIVSTEVFKCDKFTYEGEYMHYHADSAARITLKIYDPRDTRDFYRLKIRSIGTTIEAETDKTTHYASDIFWSSDVIFKDSRMTQSYGGWQKEFSPVFSDVWFNGKEYTFTVETYFQHGTSQVIVELEPLSKEFYDYLISTMMFRIKPQSDSYTETIQIHSNIDGGWGIFGAMNPLRKTLYF